MISGEITYPISSPTNHGIGYNIFFFFFFFYHISCYIWSTKHDLSLSFNINFPFISFRQIVN